MLTRGVNVITLFHNGFSSLLTREKASKNIEVSGVSEANKFSRGKLYQEHFSGQSSSQVLSRSTNYIFERNPTTSIFP